MQVFNFFTKIVDKAPKSVYNENAFGVMAQLVERLVRNEEASGSNPLSSTKTKTRLRGVFFVFRPIVRNSELMVVGVRG